MLVILSHHLGHLNVFITRLCNSRRSTPGVCLLLSSSLSQNRIFRAVPDRNPIGGTVETYAAVEEGNFKKLEHLD